MRFQVRGLGAIATMAIVPSGVGNLGRLFTSEAKHMARYQPRYGKLTPESVVQMAATTEAAKRQQMLYSEAAKHYQQMAQVAVQAHATSGQIAQATARADEGFQRTNKTLAQAGFKHVLAGNTQDVQLNTWTGRKIASKAALYG